mmetsp:Transcript_631/g.1136  ORF Transcript_631/g.1136 Transcript_631/m.1136 type:complete len:282 (-) Transcript_631:1523-2368(-)
MDEALKLAKAIRGQGLKEKSLRFGSKKVACFRGKDFKRLLKKSPPKGVTVATDQDAFKIGDMLIEKHLIKRVQGLFKTPKPKRWPDAISPSPNVTMQDDGFYIWDAKVQSKFFTNTLTTMLVLGVILACCFPIWPIQMKLGVWYLSVVLLVILLGISAVRLVLFIVLFIFGHDFWIFPNMYDDSAGLVGGFTPVYYYARREDGWFWFVVRLIVGFSVLYFPYLFYTQPTLIDDILNISVSALFDFVAWGEDKILSNSTEVSIPRYETFIGGDDEDMMYDRP